MHGIPDSFNEENPPVKIGTISTLSDRELKAEFYAAATRLDDGLSLERRPDAIAVDYLTAFSLGPIQLGDFSAGPVNRAWKVRASGTTVFSSRLNDAQDGFEDEQIVFTFSGIGATEIDVAFDQSAHILVCMERATGVGGSPEVWIYYYDPFVAGYVLTNFGAGRTPRAILDDILDSANADILVFYLVDGVGMAWRQQRERYLTQRIVNQVAPTLPDTSLMTMVGPVTWAYAHPPAIGVPGEIALDGQPTLYQSIPTPYSGPAMDIFTPYPQDHTVRIASGAGTLRVSETSSPIFATGVPGRYMNGVVHDSFLEDYGPWVGHRDYGAIIRFDRTVYYAEIEAFRMFFGGAKLRALADDYSVISEYAFATSVDATTRELGIVYSQTGFKMVALVSSAQDSTIWGNFRYSESQIPGPLTPTQFDYPNTYLEDVYKATSGRVVIIYSVRDPVLGRWSLGTIATVLYPIVLPTENWTSRQSVPLSGLIEKVLKYLMPPGYTDPVGDPPDAFDQVDEWKSVASVPLSGDLHDIVIVHTLYDIDEWKAVAPVPTSGILFQIILTHTLYDMDEWKAVMAVPTSGLLFLAVIVHTLYDVDEWKCPMAIPTSGTLV